MFQRFTDDARRSVVLAQEEAGLLGHGYIGTEHLLLGIRAEASGIAAVALHDVGVALDPLRAEVIRFVGQGRSAVTQDHHVPFTPRAKRVLELALREALDLQDDFIGTEHVLLALVQEGGGVGMQVLGSLGVTGERIRLEILRLRGLPTHHPEAVSTRRPDRPPNHAQLDRIEAALQQIEQQQGAILRSLERVQDRLPPSSDS